MTETSVSLLTAAAQKLREILGGTTEAPWTRWHDQERSPGWDGMCVIGDDSPLDSEELNPVARVYVEEDAAWILLMHPGVGLALAYWLDPTAVEMTAVDGTEYAYEEFASWMAALAVARQLLGEVTE